MWVSEREAKDEELSRGGATSRRYLAHCKRLTKLMLKLQRAGEAGSGETDEHVWFKWLDDDETSVVRVRMRETGSVYVCVRREACAVCGGWWAARVEVEATRALSAWAK